MALINNEFRISRLLCWPTRLTVAIRGEISHIGLLLEADGGLNMSSRTFWNNSRPLEHLDYTVLGYFWRIDGDFLLKTVATLTRLFQSVCCHCMICTGNGVHDTEHHLSSSQRLPDHLRCQQRRHWRPTVYADIIPMVTVGDCGFTDKCSGGFKEGDWASPFASEFFSVSHLFPYTRLACIWNKWQP